MKFKILILFTLCWVISLKFSYGQTKRALLIGIGNYPPDSGWPQISSLRDDSLIAEALAQQKFTDIKVIQDKLATMAGIRNGLEQLIERSNPGDIVVIHFSSHGEQLEDFNGNKPDGLEESIVSYQARQPPYGSEPTKEEVLKLSEGYFRDDELGRYVDRLRARLGRNGQVVVLMDLCYAGTGTRGTAKVRGGRAPLVSRGFYSSSHAITSAAKTSILLSNEANSATYTVIGAARPNESDKETFDDTKKAIGPLSYAICKVLASLDSGMTYRAFFARIQSVMNEKLPLQHPVLSGNGQDRKLFASQFVIQHPYITIDKINGKELELAAGSFAGLNTGAAIALYPAGTTDPSGQKPMATGTVVKAQIYHSWVRLNTDPGLREPALGWVFITNRVFENELLNIGFAGNSGSATGKNPGTFSPAQQIRIRKALKSIPEARFAPPLAISLVRGTGTAVDSIIISSTGQVFDTITNASKDTANLKNKIGAFIQYDFLRHVNIHDPQADLEVKLLPVRHGKPDTSYMYLNDTSFTQGDQVMIWVNNKSRQNLYINILDMQPNGVINAILPNNSQRIAAEDLMIPGGASFLFKNYIITLEPPCGKEIFKIFASADKIDLETIASTHGEGKKGSLHPFEMLLKRSYQSRAGITTSSSGSSYNLYFDIKPKQ